MALGDDILEHQIRLETLHSEKLRQSILTFLFTAVGPIVLAVMYFGPKLIEGQATEILQRLRVVVFGALTFVFCYSWLVRSLIVRAIAAKRSLPRFLRLANGFVEITLVTTVIYCFARVSDPLFAISAPPSLLYLLFLMLSILSLDVFASTFMGIVAALQYVGLSLYLLSTVDIASVAATFASPLPIFIKGLMFIGGGLLAGLVGRELKQRLVHAVSAIHERNRAVEMFGEHVSPKVAEVLLEHRGDFPGEQRDVCVMFLDIRDFTRFSEERSPHEVVSFLDTLFDPLVNIVSRHGGIVNKFLGDGFMAVFGAPVREEEPCLAAVRAALAMVEEVSAMVSSKRIPPTRIGIGLHAGLAVTGTIGARSRKEYTVIGDTVNLASRIEQLTKPFDAVVLASESVWQNVKDHGIAGEPMEKIAVKGRKAQVSVVRLR